jgi:hypothetical protein
MAAKEIVVSTLGVLYAGNDDNQTSLQQRLKAKHIPTVVRFHPIGSDRISALRAHLFSVHRNHCRYQRRIGFVEMGCIQHFLFHRLGLDGGLLVHQIGLLVAS